MKNTSNEIRELTRVVAVNTLKIENASVEIGTLKRELLDLKRFHETTVEPRTALNRADEKAAFQERARQREARIAELEKTVSKGQKAFDQLAAETADARAKLVKLQDAAERETRTTVSALVEGAVKGAKSRPAYEAAKQKRDELRKKFQAAESELTQLLATPAEDAGIEGEVKALLEGNETNAPHVNHERVRELQHSLKVLHAALPVAERAADHAQREFAGEVAGALRAHREGLAQRLGSAIREIQAIHHEDELLRTAAVVATGEDHLTSIALPLGNSALMVTGWEDRLRAAGFNL